MEKIKNTFPTPTLEIRIPVVKLEVIFTKDARMVLNPTTLPIYSFVEFNWISVCVRTR